MGQLLSVGYEGVQVDDLIRELQVAKVDVLVDVRLNAISRRRGFSKSALTAALGSAGIDYIHLRTLGNPNYNRAGFHGPGRDLAQARFRELLQSSVARQALSELDDLRREHVVAVLCFERDEVTCHRHVILDELSNPLRLVS